MGTIGLELLDQRVSQHGRHTGQALPALIAHGFHLTELALGFGALTPCIDHPITGQRQLVGADGPDAIHVDQPLGIQVGLQAVFGILQVLPQIDQAGVHPARRGHRHFHLGFQLGLDVAGCQVVGRLRSHQLVGHRDRKVDQLALALHPYGGPVHEDLRRMVHDLRFGQRLGLFTHDGVQHAADVDQRSGLLAQVELGMLGQLEVADDLFRNAAALDQAQLGL